MQHSLLLHCGTIANMIVCIHSVQNVQTVIKCMWCQKGLMCSTSTFFFVTFTWYTAFHLIHCMNWETNFRSLIWFQILQQSLLWRFYLYKNTMRILKSQICVIWHLGTKLTNQIQHAYLLNPAPLFIKRLSIFLYFNISRF